MSLTDVRPLVLVVKQPSEVCGTTTGSLSCDVLAACASECKIRYAECIRSPSAPFEVYPHSSAIRSFCTGMHLQVVCQIFTLSFTFGWSATLVLAPACLAASGARI